MCKEQVKCIVEVREPGSSWGLVNSRVYFHPRGCMRARENHLDIVVKGMPSQLRDLLFVSGVRASCSVRGSSLYIDLGYAEIRISCISMRTSSLSFSCYVMKKRGNEVYVSLPRDVLVLGS